MQLASEGIDAMQRDGKCAMQRDEIIVSYEVFSYILSL